MTTIISSTTSAEPARRSRLAIVASSAYGLERDCRHIVGHALKRGNAVLCAAPGFPIGVAGSGALAGASLMNLPTEENAPHLTNTARARTALDRAFTDWRPDTVLASDLGAVPIAQRTARRARLAHVSCLLSDVPTLPTSGFLGRIGIRRALTRALNGCRTIFVADPSVTEHLANLGIAGRSAANSVVVGTGISLADIAQRPLPEIDDGIRFAVVVEPEDDGTVPFWTDISRRLGKHGHATVVVKTRPASPFAAGSSLIAARTGPGQEDESSLAGWIAEAHVLIQLAAPQVFADSIMVALAIGRPLLAIDTPAHRRLIDERVNGVLLPSPDADAIVAGAASLLRRPDLFPSMARASRAKAERHFDATAFATRILDALQLR